MQVAHEGVSMDEATHQGRAGGLSTSRDSARPVAWRYPRSRAEGNGWPHTPYSLLDLTAMGRQGDWEEPTGRTDGLRPAQPDFAQ